jgi:hypothetical protein
MTTPHQGPGMWQQGNERAALAWLANLDARQQQALQRSIQTHQALGPIYDAVSRVNQVASQQATRLSEGAQRLASSAREFGQNTATRAGEIKQATTNRVTEIGQQAAGLGRQAVDFGQRGLDATVDRAQRAVVAAEVKAYDGMDRVGAAGKQVVETATNAGRAVVDAGRQVAGNASRWFQGKRSNASNLAQSAGAAFAAFRMDPRLQQSNISPMDVKNLAERAQAILSAQTPEAQTEAINQFAQAAQGLQGNNENAQQGGGQHRAEVNMAWVNAGTAPASGAVALKPPTGQQQGQTPQSNDHNRHRGKPEQER